VYEFNFKAYTMVALKLYIGYFGKFYRMQDFHSWSIVLTINPSNWKFAGLNGFAAAYDITGTKIIN